MKLNLIISLLLLLFTTINSLAQDSVSVEQTIDVIYSDGNTDDIKNEGIITDQPSSEDTSPQVSTWVEFIRGGVVALFGLAILGAVLWFASQTEGKKLDTSISQFLTLFLLIINTVIMVTIGFSTEQISTVLGLFGTLAGYVLGKQNSNAELEKRINQLEAQNNTQETQQQPENTNLTNS